MVLAVGLLDLVSIALLCLSKSGLTAKERVLTTVLGLAGARGRLFVCGVPDTRILGAESETA